MTTGAVQRTCSAGIQQQLAVLPLAKALMLIAG